MKRQLLNLMAIAAFATTLTANASAQTGKSVKAHINFEFQIGERVYPAGQYRIESLNGQSDNILLIRSVDHPTKRQIILANHSIAGKGNKPKLVFQKFGQNYFLTEIFLETDYWGYSIRPSRLQQEIEKQLASRITRSN